MSLLLTVSGLAACGLVLHYGRVVTDNMRMRSLVIELGLADAAIHRNAANDIPGLMNDVFGRLREVSTLLLFKTELEAAALRDSGIATESEMEHVQCAVAEVRLLLSNAGTLNCWCLDTRAENSPALLEHPDMAPLVKEWQKLCRQCVFATRYLKKSFILSQQQAAA